MEIRDFQNLVQPVILPPHLSDKTVFLYKWKMRFFAAYDWVNKQLGSERFLVYMLPVAVIDTVRLVSHKILSKQHTLIQQLDCCGKIIEKGYMVIFLAGFAVLSAGYLLKKTTSQNDAQYKQYLTDLVKQLLQQDPKEYLQVAHKIKEIESLLSKNAKHEEQQLNKDFIDGLLSLLINACIAQHKDRDTPAVRGALLILAYNHYRKDERERYSKTYEERCKGKQESAQFWLQERAKLPVGLRGVDQPMQQIHRPSPATEQSNRGVLLPTIAKKVETSVSIQEISQPSATPRKISYLEAQSYLGNEADLYNKIEEVRRECGILDAGRYLYPEKRLDRRYRILLAVDDQENIVGFLAGVIKADHVVRGKLKEPAHFHLGILCVRQAFRRTKEQVGTKLMRYAMQEAQAAGAFRLTLEYDYSAIGRSYAAQANCARRRSFYGGLKNKCRDLVSDYTETISVGDPDMMDACYTLNPLVRS